MEEIIYWIWFSRLFSYGDYRAAIVLSHIDYDPKGLYQKDISELKAMNLFSKSDIETITHTSLESAEFILENCQKEDIQIIPYTSEQFPQRLKNIYAPPVVIYVKGTLNDIDKQAAIAVVGTRSASDYGKSVTGNLSYELAKAGMIIISGCAVGIDAFAHTGALKAGGITIGVMGCGLDVDYPVENRTLKQAILKKGALISEYPPKEQPIGYHFPIRNRIISALSLGVLITEAPEKSGALITAEHALEQGKDVFCVPPHHIYDKRFAGVVKYLRDRAIPVFSAQDILSYYVDYYAHCLNAEYIYVPFEKHTSRTVGKNMLKQTVISEREDEKTTSEQPIINDSLASIDDDHWSEEAKKIFELLTIEPQIVDEIVIKSELSLQLVRAALTELELEGLVCSHSGGRFSRWK